MGMNPLVSARETSLLEKFSETPEYPRSPMLY
jgi:hypothetical protein